jgi:hypothetical protein
MSSPFVECILLCCALPARCMPSAGCLQKNTQIQNKDTKQLKHKDTLLQNKDPNYKQRPYYKPRPLNTIQRPETKKRDPTTTKPRPKYKMKTLLTSVTLKWSNQKPGYYVMYPSILDVAVIKI